MAIEYRFNFECPDTVFKFEQIKTKYDSNEYGVHQDDFAWLLKFLNATCESHVRRHDKMREMHELLEQLMGYVADSAKKQYAEFKVLESKYDELWKVNWYAL